MVPVFFKDSYLLSVLGNDPDLSLAINTFEKMDCFFRLFVDESPRYTVFSMVEVRRVSMVECALGCSLRKPILDVECIMLALLLACGIKGCLCSNADDIPVFSKRVCGMSLLRSKSLLLMLRAKMFKYFWNSAVYSGTMPAKPADVPCELASCSCAALAVPFGSTRWLSLSLLAVPPLSSSS